MQGRQNSTKGRQVNHARLNYQQIKEQEALNKERLRQDQYETDRAKRLDQTLRSQYGHVGSSVSKENLSTMGNQSKSYTQKAPGDDVEIKVYVRECDQDAQAFAMMESSAMQSSPQAPNRQPVQNSAPSSFAYVSQSRSVQSQGPSALSHQAGEVPRYLVQRKAEMAAEKAEIQRQLDIKTEQAKYPPGHRPVSEEERADILAKLEERKKQLEWDLNRLPMRVDTQAVQRKRQQIENELDEIDAAYAKFSVKKQLFVPI